MQPRRRQRFRPRRRDAYATTHSVAICCFSPQRILQLGRCSTPFHGFGIQQIRQDTGDTGTGMGGAFTDLQGAVTQTVLRIRIPAVEGWLKAGSGPPLRVASCSKLLLVFVDLPSCSHAGAFVEAECSCDVGCIDIEIDDCTSPGAEHFNGVCQERMSYTLSTPRLFHAEGENVGLLRVAGVA